MNVKKENIITLVCVCVKVKDVCFYTFNTISLNIGSTAAKINPNLMWRKQHVILPKGDSIYWHKSSILLDLEFYAFKKSIHFQI